MATRTPGAVPSPTPFFSGPPQQQQQQQQQQHPRSSSVPDAPEHQQLQQQQEHLRAASAHSASSSISVSVTTEAAPVPLPPPPPTPAYLLEWPTSTSAHGGGGGGGCTRTPLASADDLRWRLLRPPPPPGQQRDTHDGRRRLLFVVHDGDGDGDGGALPPGYADALCGALGVDPAFVEAHARRRRYRPPVRLRVASRRGRGGANFACYIYPELVSVPMGMGTGRGRRRGAGNGAGAKSAGVKVGPGEKVKEKEGEKKKKTTTAKNGSGSGPPVRLLSKDGGVDVALCRASLWIGSSGGAARAGADVLLLDRPSLQGDAATTAPPPSAATGHPSKSLEDMLYEALDSGGAAAAEDGEDEAEAQGDEDGEASSSSLCGVVAQLAYEHWLEFFDSLPAPITPKSTAEDEAATATATVTAALYWEMAQALEQNLALAQYLRQRPPDYPDWQALLARLQRCVELLALARLPPPGKGVSGSGKKTPSGLPKQKSTLSSSSYHSYKRMFDTAGLPLSTIEPPQPLPLPPSPDDETEDERQRALNRVSYMGGVLLPFSIVSGILSMSDPFAAGDALFWVFWAIAVPLALLTLLVIYCDIIRKAEVWVEVAAEGVQNAIGGSLAAGGPGGGGGGGGGAGTAPGSSGSGGEEGGEAKVESPVVGEVEAGGRKFTFYRLGKPEEAEEEGGGTAGGGGGGGAEARRRRRDRQQQQGRRRRYPTVSYNPGDQAVVIDMRTPGPAPPPTPVPVPSFPPPPPPPPPPPAPMPIPPDEIESAPASEGEGSGTTEEEEEPFPGEEEETQPFEPTMILERPSDGSRPKAWKRQQLGWAGALMAIVGYRRPRRAEDVPVPAAPWARGRRGRAMARYQRQRTMTY